MYVYTPVMASSTEKGRNMLCHEDAVCLFLQQKSPHLFLAPVSSPIASAVDAAATNCFHCSHSSTSSGGGGSSSSTLVVLFCLYCCRS